MNIIEEGRWEDGMTSAVAQLTALRLLRVGLHVVWVVPQRLVYCAVETAAVL
jgi:hypothetical protein